MPEGTPDQNSSTDTPAKVSPIAPCREISLVTRGGGANFSRFSLKSMRLFGVSNPPLNPRNGTRFCGKYHNPFVSLSVPVRA